MTACPVHADIPSRDGIPGVAAVERSEAEAVLITDVALERAGSVIRTDGGRI